MLIAVVDASVLVSGMLTSGPPGRLLELARSGAFELWTSDTLLAETRRALQKPKIVRAYGHAEPEAEAFLDLLLSFARLVGPLPSIPPICRDPDDDHVLAAALAARADAIVTGDRDLLLLGSYRGVEIVGARGFLDRLMAAGPPDPGRKAGEVP